MLTKICGFFLTTVTLIAMVSCSGQHEVGQVEEYVPGIKRWAGPFKRITDPSTQPSKSLGSPDIEITVDVFTSEFNPNVIKVKQNQVVKLVLKGIDNGDLPKITALKEFSGHGFHVIGPYDIWITGLRADVTREIIFKATVAGEFDFECPVFCGVNHYKMRGKLIVEPV